jgi:hypothetical protein
MSIGENVKFYINVKKYFFIEFLKTSYRYYRNIKFLIFDLSFSIVYLFINPYRTSRKFKEKKFNKKIYDYGETPLSQIELISKECNVSSATRFLELGSGRGKISFWLYFFYNCNIIAIEEIPVFVTIASFFVKLFRIKKIKFLNKDFNDFIIEDIDLIYLYGTTLSDENIKILIEKFKKLPTLTIVTISYSLNEYDKSFTTQKSFDLSFPWGTTKAYINVIRRQIYAKTY